jgi:photosystem II stability/assembly factor-like uncharacterized protein
LASSPNRLDVVGDTAIAYGGAGALALSNDLGATWTEFPQQFVGGNNANNFYGIARSGPDIVLVGGSSFVSARSRDAGATWALVPVGMNQRLVDTVHEAGAWVVIGNDFRASTYGVSRDRGQSWTYFPLGPARSVMAGAGANGILHLIGEVAQPEYAPGLILRSADAGRTWTEWRTPMNGFLYAISGQGNLWLALGGSDSPYELIAFRSTDGGLNWSQGAIDAAYDNNIVSVHSAGGVAVAVGSFDALILRSTDDGATWTRTPVCGQYFDEVWGNGTDWVAVGADNTSGVICHSHDGGATWAPIPTAFRITSVFGEGDLVLATGAGSAVYRSTDRGQTFTEIAATAGGRVRGSGALLVSNGGGIDVSVDAGLTWSSAAHFVPGFPLGTALMDVHQASDGTVMVVGDGGTALLLGPP